MNQYATTRSAAPLVVKYGGAAMPHAGAPDPLLAEVAELWLAGQPVVLVHGGGPEIDRCLAERGITTERVDGLRVTDARTLETTEAVLCATLNKRLVRACVALGLPAVGISGQDGDTLVAKRALSTAGASLGFVGKVIACNPRLIHALLAAGFFPIVAPLAIANDAAHAFNINADLAAAALAGALQAQAFIAVTNVPRVLRDPDDPSSGIDRFDLAEAHAFARSNACRSSMKPKLDAAIAAVEGGARGAYICDGRPGTLRRALESNDATVVANHRL